LGPEDCGGVACTRTPRRVPGVSGAVDIAAALSHVCAVLADGGARCWGDNQNASLGIGTDRGPLYDELGESLSIEAVAPLGLSNVAQVSTKLYTTCAVMKDGSLSCWGDNTRSQLGLGLTAWPDHCFNTTNCSMKPVPVSQPAAGARQ